MRARRSIAMVLGLAMVASPLAVLGFATPAGAATTLAVDQAADEAPDPGNQCTAAPDDCSLRQAVDAAVDGDTITFGVNLDPTLTLGQIELTEDLTIDGEGGQTDVNDAEPSLRGTRIDAAHASRIFDIAAGADVVLTDLILQRGQAPAGEDGGGVRNAGTLRVERVTATNNRTTGSGDGGGLWSSGALTVVDVLFSGMIAVPNTAPNQAGGDGGALASTGALSVERATFDQNVAAGINGGGAIAVDGGTADILNATFFRNVTTGGVGGALYVGGGGQASLVSATVARNEAALGGGGIGTDGGAALEVEASWLQDNAPDTCGGPMTAGADSLVWPADTSCPATMTVAQAWPTTVPAPSGHAATFTPVIRIEQGSPAMDAIPAPGGVCSLGAHADQREIARPFGAGCDVGAFEAIENLFVAFDANVTAATMSFPDGVERDVPLYVGNNGHRTAFGVQVQVTFPPGVAVHSVTPPAGTTYDAGTGVWTVGDLPTGGITIDPLMLRLSRNAPGDHVVTAEISSDEPGTAETGTLTVHEPVDRYAVPGGPAEGECLTLATGCGIEYAIERAAQEGETTLVAPGEHVVTPGASVFFADQSMVGLDPTHRPVIRGDFAGTFMTTGGHVRIADVDIENPTRDGISVGVGADVELERVSITTARRVVFVGNGTSVTIRDSALEALGTFTNAQPAQQALNLSGPATVENVTIIGRGRGAVEARAAGSTHTLHNVIARDVGDGTTTGLDVSAVSGATIDLTSSNYETTGGAGTITPAGTAGNQTAAPVFVDLAGHNLHQAVGSPTIDAGTGTPGDERRDIDGDHRLQGVAVDIGADEAQPEPSVWTGAGDDDLWSNPDNWEDGDVPGAHGAVVLPAGPTDRATVADVDVALRSLTVEGDGYAIGGAGLVDVAGGSFSVAAGTTLSLVADVDLPGDFLGSPPQGIVVLAGDQERVDEWHIFGEAPTVVVTGTYPNLAITRCDVRCDVAPGAVVGALSGLREGRISGTVLGQLSGKGSAGNLFIGPVDATSGSTAYAGGLGYGTQGRLVVRVFADGTADRVVVAGEVTIGQSGVIWAIGPEAFSGPAPQSIVVVDNDGTDPVGRTLDIPRTVELGGVLYRITLDGGDGNDVALVQPDSSGPEITPTIDPAPRASGWHAQTVNVSWSVTDDEGPFTTTGCDPTEISEDTPVAGVTLTCEATSEGGTTSESVTIKRDTVDPELTPLVEPASPSPSGWYLTAPTVSFICSDALSGLGGSCPAPRTLDSALGPQSVNAGIKDVAGNSAVVFVLGLLVDLVDPVVVCPEGVSFDVGEVGLVTAEVSDVHSGPVDAVVSADAVTSSPGVRAVSLTGADVAGNTTTVSCSYSVADPSAPEVTATVDPATPENGWHTTDVTVTWSIKDEESEITDTDGCGETTVSADTTGLILTCTATSAGGVGTGTVTIQRDATAPSITASVDPAAPNGFGWRQAATVSFDCDDDDPGSGVASCPVSVVLGSSATAQSVTGTAVDVAGNTADATASGLLVDGVAPTIVCGATPTFVVGEQGIVRGTVTDEHSGPAGGSVATGPANTTQAGTFSRILRAQDRAGNTTSVPCPYVVQKTATVLDAHPVLLKLTGGVTVTFPLSARLTTAGGAPVAGQAVRFTAGSRVLCTATTNSAGWASCGGTGAWTMAVLNGGFTATYAGTAAYEPSTDTAGLVG